MENQSFNDKLRAAARALAIGDIQELVIPFNAIVAALAGKKSATSPASYIRTTMNRVAEVREAGTVKVKKGECNNPESDYFGMDVLTITICTTDRKTIYDKKDVERIKKATARKVAEKILTLSPNLANYAPEEYATLAKAVAEFHELVKSNFITEE